MVISNIWAMHHDEESYTDPTVFNPERFLSNASDNDHTNSAGLTEDHYGFGFGRRFV